MTNKTSGLQRTRLGISRAYQRMKARWYSTPFKPAGFGRFKNKSSFSYKRVFPAQRSYDVNFGAKFFADLQKLNLM